MSTSVPEITTCIAPDGRRLAQRHFAPTREPLATVVLLHGIVSHSGWYHVSAEYLAGRGYDVYALDRRGSGLNMEGRGDVDVWHTWIKDVVSVCETHRPSGPVVLLGISWGGKLAPAVARFRPDLLAGFGMICPGIYARQQPGLVKRLALVASGRLGIHERRVSVPLQNPALFTESPKWQEYIRNDPLTLRQVTMRFAREDHKLTRYARQSPRYIYTPSLMMLAGRDRMVRNRRSSRFLSRIAADDKMLLEYPSAAHTLEFEPDPLPFFADLAEWVARVTERRKV